MFTTYFEIILNVIKQTTFMLVLPVKQKREQTRAIKPWGFFEKLTENEESTIKLITVHAGKRTSLQSHKLRSERWHVLSGQGHAIIHDDKIPLRQGDELFIPKTETHRLEATTDMQILEISFGLFRESDIIRFEDDYDRI